MRLGNLGIALMKALSIEPEFEDEKVRVTIPSSFELLERRMKPLTEEEYEQLRKRKKHAYEENKKKALEVYKKLKRGLEIELRRKKKAVEKISRVVEEIDRKLKENPTDTRLIKKLQKWIELLTHRQMEIEYLENELSKFEQFIESFEALPAIDFPLWEETGRSEGSPPRKYAEPEEYSDLEGFSIHYLNEIF